MKKYLICVALSIALAACKHTDPKLKVESVRFPAPIAAADREVAQKKDVSLPADDAADGNAMTADTTAALHIIMPPGSSRPAAGDTAKKIIKEGDIIFETKDVNVTRKALLRNLAKLGGYADEDNETLASDSDRKEYQIKARIPAKYFDIFLDSLSSGAVNIDSRHVSISDVTTRYIDMKTRLSNQKILEATYIGLLKRASRMKDVLDIEDKITETRTEIESEQGELNFLSRQVAYSTLDITFYSSQMPREIRNSAGHRIASAFKDGWHILQGMFFGLISVWPITILTVIGIMVFRKWLRNRKIVIKQPA
ncbi:MAG TPA: DUF4349 domain-containing protein [Mucilaginibacter sp.]|jgi:hypothetical protein|nr:DUF4349 domain-containing protein [Mucilaginibacter sp.]